MFKEELITILFNFFQKRGENTSNSFYKANITLVPILDRDGRKKKKLAFMKIDSEILNKIFNK